jgi:hypothetical protein
MTFPGRFDFKPQTSATYKPGFQLDPGRAGMTTNTAWREAALSLLRYQWATSDPSTRQQLAGEFGTPLGEQDSIYRDPETGLVQIYSSPETNLILSYYLDSYSGGNQYLDERLPYIAPTANEYIETPDAFATRVNNELLNADFDLKQKQYGLDVRQEDRLLAGQKLDYNLGLAQIQSGERIAAASEAGRIAAARISADASVQSSQIAAGATVQAANISAAASRYAADLGFDASVYSTQGQLFSAIEQGKSSRFATEANIFNTQTTARSNALNTAATLGLGLQQLGDTRVQDIIRNLANPIDLVQREYATRALPGAPEQNRIVAYSDIPGLSSILAAAKDFQPQPGPSAPGIGDVPVAPTRPGGTTSSTTNPPPKKKKPVPTTGHDEGDE